MIALSDWVLWASHHAQVLAPSPSPSPTPAPANGSSTGIVPWITLIAAALAATVAGFGVYYQHLNATKATDATTQASKELDVWRQREETMRMLRWAIENAVKADPAASNAGQITLEALRTGTLVQPMDVTFIDQIVEAIVAPVATLVEEGDDVDVVVVDPRPRDNVPRPPEWEQ